MALSVSGLEHIPAAKAACWRLPIQNPGPAPCASLCSLGPETLWALLRAWGLSQAPGDGKSVEPGLKLKTLLSLDVEPGWEEVGTEAIAFTPQEVWQDGTPLLAVGTGRPQGQPALGAASYHGAFSLSFFSDLLQPK